VGRAAIVAGCQAYYGYPITPQNEIGEYVSRHLPEAGGIFIQAESEVSAINMVFGAAVAGHRVMTSTSSPGYSLMLEGISNISGAEVPAVIVNASRGGPGGGNLEPTQLDYLSSARSGGHGGYCNIVLAPNSVQELFDLVQLAFDLADIYRMIVIVLTDGALVQMMEPVEIRRVTIERELPAKDWALTGKRGRKRNLLASTWALPGSLDAFHRHLQAKYQEIAEKEVRWEGFELEDAELVVVAYGVVARMARGGVESACEEGLKAGLLGPITAWPLPSKLINQLASEGRQFLMIEGNMGQMLLELERAVQWKAPVHFMGQANNFIPPAEIKGKIEEILGH